MGDARLEGSAMGLYGTYNLAASFSRRALQQRLDGQPVLVTTMGVWGGGGQSDKESQAGVVRKSIIISGGFRGRIIAVGRVCSSRRHRHSD